MGNKRQKCHFVGQLAANADPKGPALNDACNERFVLRQPPAEVVGESRSRTAAAQSAANGLFRQRAADAGAAGVQPAFRLSSPALDAHPAG